MYLFLVKFFWARNSFNFLSVCWWCVLSWAVLKSATQTQWNSSGKLNRTESDVQSAISKKKDFFKNWKKIEHWFRWDDFFFDNGSSWILHNIQSDGPIEMNFAVMVQWHWFSFYFRNMRLFASMWFEKENEDKMILEERKHKIPAKIIKLR